MTRIKICGISDVEEIKYVNEAMPDYIGFVFAPGKRQIDMEQAEKLKSKLSKEIKAVGVFVNNDADFIKLLCDRNVIDIIQLHGDEDESIIKEFDKPVIKAVRVSKEDDVIDTTADFILFDAYKKGSYGGTGATFDWRLVSHYNKPFFLAGGINISNIETAIKTAHPYCVDISSGAETNGKKDREKIISMVNLVRRK